MLCFFVLGNSGLLHFTIIKEKIRYFLKIWLVPNFFLYKKFIVNNFQEKEKRSFFSKEFYYKCRKRMVRKLRILAIADKVLKMRQGGLL